MKIVEQKIKNAYVIEPKTYSDTRGFFMRTYAHEIFEKYGIERDWVQDNHSCSTKKGIVRGLHFQLPPHAETKLIRCIRGAIYDVYVDLRKNSQTFGKWEALELSEGNKKMLYIPRGFAHGFCTLEDICEVLYKVDNHYAPKAEGGIIWNDAKLKIVWPVDKPLLSDRDAGLMNFTEFVEKHGALDVLE
jgi:dTDP-4-dehydrorhamnose 3,5-epimerase